MSLRGGSSAPLSKVAMRRLLTELESLARDPPPLISACPVSEERWHEWDCVIVGPDDTLYAGGAFRAKLLFPAQYPMQPPKMVFTSAMWHPNIYKGGDVSARRKLALPECRPRARDPGQPLADRQLEAAAPNATRRPLPRHLLPSRCCVDRTVPDRSEMARCASPRSTRQRATQ